MYEVIYCLLSRSAGKSTGRKGNEKSFPGLFIDFDFSGFLSTSISLTKAEAFFPFFRYPNSSGKGHEIGIRGCEIKGN